MYVERMVARDLPADSNRLDHRSGPDGQDVPTLAHARESTGVAQCRDLARCDAALAQPKRGNEATAFGGKVIK